MMLRRIAALCAFALFAGSAHAHGATPGVNAFIGGLLHPLTALEHVLPLIALGMLAAQRGLMQGQGLLIAFPLAFALSALAGTALPFGFEGPGLNASTALVAGGLVAWALALPRSVLYGITIAIGAIHGVAQSSAAASGTSVVMFIAGSTLSAALVFAYAFAAIDRLLVRNANRSWLSIAVRAFGSWIAAFGILTLAVVSLPVRASGL